MIELDNIAKTYRGPRGSVEALRGVSLKVEAGEIFGIIGRSGAGKSTLIRCVNLLERPTAGRVLVAGQELTALPAEQVRASRRHIGMIFQHFNLLSSRTALDNVALPLELAGVSKRAARARALPLLDLVGLSDQRSQYPSQLSGGQKQRVGIARALASEPRVLLCDEATSALDPETTRSILTLLQDIRKRLGLTILLITHEMSVVREICDGVAVLEAGQIVEQGRTFDVFTQPKTSTARSLLGDLIGQDLPAGLMARIRPEVEAGRGRLWRIVFTGASAEKPVLSELSRRFGLDVNIVYGRIEEIQGSSFGSLVVLASGASSGLDDARVYLKQLNLQVEDLSHVAPVIRAAD
jgi:D-methionine transport system ATP-binding protein